MKMISYTTARKNLSNAMEMVCGAQETVVITRKTGPAVVMLSLADYESLQETAYLMRTSANVKRLLAALESMEQGCET